MTSFPQLNPLTPLAYVEPSIALQVEASRYLFFGVLGAFVWDWLMSLSEEYRMIRTAERPLPIIVYFLARFGALGYQLTAILFQSATIADCNGLLIGLGICCLIAMPAASLLFYIRVWAIYYNNRVVRGFFALLWLSVLATTIALPFGLKGAHIGPTQYCMNSVVHSYTSSNLITTAVNDTFILIAILYKLAWNNSRMNHTWREIATSPFKLDGLNTVSKTVCQSGLIYYITTVSVNIVAMVVILTPSVPPVYRSMVAPPNIAIQNVMVCRVFRKLRLGIIGKLDVESSQQSVPSSWKRPEVRMMPRSAGTFDSKPTHSLSDEGYLSSDMSIKVTRDVELAVDSGC